MGNSSSKTLLYPAELKYVKTHEFIRIDGQEAVIGITAFAADQLGDVTYVELPKVGAKLAKEARFGVIESVKSVSDLYMPLSGEILAVNERLSSEPEIVNMDCYNDGWMIKIKLDNVSELNDVLTSDQYKQFVVE